MISSTSLVYFLFLGGLQLVNAQTTITVFADAASDAVPSPVEAQGTGQFTPIGVLSDGKVVFTEHAIATVSGVGVGTFDGLAVEGSNDDEFTAVITAEASGGTAVLNVEESCSFGAASAAGAQPTGNCVIAEDITIVGPSLGLAAHTTTTIAATRFAFTTLTVSTALPTLSLNLKKGGANGLKATFASVLGGVALGAARIWL